MGIIMLKNIITQSAGRYHCEVVLEPHIRTISKHRHLIVVDELPPPPLPPNDHSSLTSTSTPTSDNLAVTFPETVPIGTNLTLNCTLTASPLSSEALYSLKWYKDDIELYRYLPKDFPPQQYF